MLTILMALVPTRVAQPITPSKESMARPCDLGADACHGKRTSRGRAMSWDQVCHDDEYDLDLALDRTPDPLMFPTRKKCELCRRTPGRRIECPQCKRHVGPGCCWIEDKNACSMCATQEPEPEPERPPSWWSFHQSGATRGGFVVVRPGLVKEPCELCGHSPRYRHVRLTCPRCLLRVGTRCPGNRCWCAISRCCVFDCAEDCCVASEWTDSDATEGRDAADTSGQIDRD